MSEKKKRPAALCSPLCKEEFNQPFDAFSRLLVLHIYLLVFTLLCSMDPEAYRQTHKIYLEFKKVQLNKYETAPNLIHLSQNLTSDCLLI